jgi:uncharacterized protein (DUF58 family)
MNEIIRKLSKYEIKIRQTIHTRLQGNFHSIFKGTGIEFDDLRAYQYGDDVRTIDWATTAKGHGTYVRTFKEEKEQQVLLLLDVSASLSTGNMSVKKIDMAKEICGILALSAVKEHSDVGLVCFSDKKELYLKPNKGQKHAFGLIKKMYQLEPNSKETNLDQAILYTLNTLKKHSVVVMISDFISKNYEKSLKALALKHDLVIIHLSEPNEFNFPKLGTIPVINKETGKTYWINTFSKGFRIQMEAELRQKKEQLQSLASKLSVSYLWVNTEESYLPKLVNLFNTRKSKN